MRGNMKKFGFLIGKWELDYRIPESPMHRAATGSGEGEFKRILDDRYVVFDYTSVIEGQTGSAHGIFARDRQEGIYRYWWFESSGNYARADCRFLNDGLLFMTWQDSHLRQTFEKTGKDSVVLRMESPDEQGEYRLVMEVGLSREEGRNQVRG